MEKFQQMLQRVVSSVYYDKMTRFVRPLEEGLGINHFWYNRVTYSGHYTFIGTHQGWNKFFFDNNFFAAIPFFRHPDSVTEGICLMKNTSIDPWRDLMNTATKSFDINFHIFLLNKTPNGLEGFGFGTHQKYRVSDEHLLNQLPLLKNFIKQLRKENQAIFNIAHDNQVDLIPIIGSAFYEKPQKPDFSLKREEFLRKMGYGDILDFSSKEKSVFKALANGFPAKYIAKKLFLSSRTIEHYIENIKQKLSIHSKVELIEKAKEFNDVYDDFIKF